MDVDGQDNDLRRKATLCETGVLDGHEQVLLEMGTSDKGQSVPPKVQEEYTLDLGDSPLESSERQTSEQGLTESPSSERQSSEQESTESQSSEQHDTQEEGNGDTSLPLSVNVEQYNEPNRTLLVYNNPTKGSEVRINVVSFIPLDALQEPDLGTGPEPATESTADVQSVSEDMNVEDKRDEEDASRNKTEETPANPAGETTIYSCNQCEFTTTKRYQDMNHRILHAVPDKDLLFHCSQCSYSTKQRFNLKTHVKSHFDISEMDPSDLFKCKDCDYVSLYKHDLQTHSKKHNPEKQFRCFHCDFSSIYRHSLLHHISSKHQGIRPFRCSLCDYSAAKKQDLETHMFKHNKEKRYKCPECDYETTFKQSLKNHANTHRGHKPFKCTHPGCSFSATSKVNLTSHMKIHISKIQCPECNYETANPEKFASHICHEAKQKMAIKEKIRATKVSEPLKRADGKLEYGCQECNYTSNSKHSMKRHSQIHDKERERPDKIHRCDQCGYVTAYKSSLTRHMARHAPVKPFKCGHCDYTAITMTQMHIHIAKHTGIKAYACDLCTYSTANKQHLTNHMAKHSKLRYKCNACGHLTAWKDRMRIHLRLHQQGQILGRSVQTQETVQVLSVEEGQLYTTEHVQVLSIVEGECHQEVEGSETLLVMNQLADRIQEEFMTIGQDEANGKAITQEEVQGMAIAHQEVLIESMGQERQQDLIIVGDGEQASQQVNHQVRQQLSQNDTEEGTLTIVTDHDGPSDLHLHPSHPESEPVGESGISSVIELTGEAT